MAFSIRSRDGRIRIGTPNAAAAADHAARLRRQGHAVEIVDAINGRRFTLSRLRREVDAG